MNERPSVLVLEDDRNMRLKLEEELGEAGYEVLTAAGGDEALEQLDGREVDVVIADVAVAGMSGRDLLPAIRAKWPDLPVVVTTAFGSVEAAVEAIKSGAYHYVAKPFRMDQILVTLGNAVREARLRRELERLRVTHGAAGPEIVGENPAMRRAVALIDRAAAADTPVLLLGESGTGKELFARALHRRGPRCNRPFVAVNCSAIPDALLESHLFGHRRGAFTDAREDRAGLFVETGGGTLLLDEIGDMPPHLQAKMLRVIQEREVHPLGAPAPVPVDVRIVASTNQDLEKLISQGRFRSDLYYRLNVISIEIPPLRERPEDLIPLIAHFLEKHGRRLGRAGCRVSQGALAALRRHPWSGNVRELENVIERALVLGPDHEIGLDDLPAAVRSAPGGATGAAGGPGGLRPLAEVEREHILRALRVAGGNKTAAARLLGLDRKTLYRKLRQFDLPAD